MAGAQKEDGGKEQDEKGYSHVNTSLMRLLRRWVCGVVGRDAVDIGNGGNTCERVIGFDCGVDDVIRVERLDQPAHIRIERHEFGVVGLAPIKR